MVPERALRILVADDNPDLRALIVIMLRHEGHLVDECGDGINPLTLYRMHVHDLLVLGDPPEPKLEIVTRLRTAGDRTPVVLLSADEYGSVHESSTRHEGVVFLKKPFLRGELLGVVGKAAMLVL